MPMLPVFEQLHSFWQEISSAPGDTDPGPPSRRSVHEEHPGATVFCFNIVRCQHNPSRLSVGGRYFLVFETGNLMAPHILGFNSHLYINGSSCKVTN